MVEPCCIFEIFLHIEFIEATDRCTPPFDTCTSPSRNGMLRGTRVLVGRRIDYSIEGCYSKKYPPVKHTILYKTTAKSY